MKKILKLYQKGVGYVVIAKQLNLGQYHVWRILAEAGLLKLPNRHAGKEEKCLALYKEGASKEKIRKTLKISEQSILLILLNNNCEIRPQSFYQKGETHPCWKNGRIIEKGGYVLIYSPNHPHKRKNNKVYEHRLVMEKYLGRFLTREEVVDHINGKTYDNRIENLRLFQNNAEHLRMTLVGKTPKWTELGKAKILESVRKQRKSRSKYDAQG